MATLLSVAIPAHADGVLLPPQNLHTEISGDQATLTWEAPVQGDATAYAIYRLENGTRQRLGEVGASTRAFVAPWSNLTAAYWVTAKSGSAESAPALSIVYPYCNNWYQVDVPPVKFECLWPLPLCGPLQIDDACSKVKNVAGLVLIDDGRE